MADIPKVDAGHGAGPRNIEMRFTMREVLLLHSALQHRHETLAKDAWWAAKRGDRQRAAQLQEQADEQHDLAGRLFSVLEGMMETKR
ncbi:hypothetical protein MFUR16E_04660 [Methylobacterium fujisawaense]|uniref:hypothetical protein n=1 Tax=Methylobacterium fujisawaense TaxID=107400 RepID=UPI002F34E450